RLRGETGPSAVLLLRDAHDVRDVCVLPSARARETTSMKLEAGDLVLLIDKRGRRYLVTLQAGGSFHSHHGPVPFDEIIGVEEGTEVKTSLGRRMRVLRPTLADFILKMPRGAQVIYPKDLGAL